MNYKNFYGALLFRILILISLTVLSTWLIIVEQAYILSSGILVLLSVTVINMIYYFNNINRWISFFLLGIENEDTTLKPPPKSGNKAIDDVYLGMNRLNEIFKQTKIDINTQEQYYRSVINQSATGLFSVNEKGRIINLNPAAEKLTKLHEYYHINALMQIDEALPPFILEPKTSKAKQSAIFENQYGQKLLFKISEIKTSKEIIKLVAVSDITKELDNREVDAWIKLARTLSHEIMNNITPITTLSQVISGYFTKNQEIIEAKDLEAKMIANTVKGLQVIEERSRGLMNFVDSYRNFTKLPSPKYNLTNISELLENNLLAASAFSGFETIHVEKIIPLQIFTQTDETLFSQVVTNLLKNAIECMVQSLTENPKLKMSLVEKNQRIQIEISNNGPKIPPEIREQIFVPFFTTKEDGSGIGLSLSKQIMLKMNGDIWLKNTSELSSTFVITIN